MRPTQPSGPRSENKGTSRVQTAEVTPLVRKDEFTQTREYFHARARTGQPATRAAREAEKGAVSCHVFREEVTEERT